MRKGKEQEAGTGTVSASCLSFYTHLYAQRHVLLTKLSSILYLFYGNLLRVAYALLAGALFFVRALPLGAAQAKPPCHLLPV